MKLFIPILGIIFSGIGLSKAATLGEKGSGFAIAGLTISIVTIVLNIILSIVYWSWVMAWINSIFGQLSY